MKRFLVVSAVFYALCVFALPARADVTIKATTRGPMGASQATMAIKGTKMRSDTTLTGHQMATVMDATGKQMLVLDPETKTATTYDLKKLSTQLQESMKPEDTTVSLAPNGQTKQLLGRTCTGYMLTMNTLVSMGGPNMVKVTISGLVWIAKDAPGSKDFATFFRVASENGLFFVPQGGRGGAGEGRSQALMYKAFADAGGIPYEQEIKVHIEGMPMEAPAVTMTVTAVTTDPIPDEAFEIPAGYIKK